VPGHFIYNGPSAIDEYMISNLSIYETQLCKTDHIFASITMQRGLLGFFLTVCLPTLVANVIGHITNYFADSRFDVAIGVNLTLLLVLTTT
jgi:hypothetical protein